MPSATTIRRAAIVGLGVVAGALLIAAELSTISRTEIGAAGCEQLAGRALADGCQATGGERHGYTLVVLALVAVAMAWGAARRDSRPAAAALAGVGLVTAAIALLVDAPTLGDTGTLGQLFTDVRTTIGTGFWLEVAGALAALAAGALGLVPRPPAPALAAPHAETVAAIEPASAPDPVPTRTG